MVILGRLVIKGETTIVVVGSEIIIMLRDKVNLLG